MTRAILAAAAAAGVAACTPTFDDTTSIVSGPRLLAVQASPAEVAVGKSFGMTALYVGPGGAEDASAIDWAICLVQNPLGDPDPIAPTCFGEAGASSVPLATGGSTTGTVPADACELFGPDSLPPAPGEPAARPTDPDATGGFYLPVSVRSDGDQWSAAEERIACQPSGVTLAVQTAFASGYVPNENPAVASLSVVGASGAQTPIAPDAPGKGPGITLAAGQRVSLAVAWAGCPSTATACSGAETYLLVDPTTKQIATARESIVASWYATGGAFDLDRDGRTSSDTATSVANGWTAPTSAGTVHLWVVLRDDRGGVGWGSFTIAVQ